jgi:hypothetical protein
VPFIFNRLLINKNTSICCECEFLSALEFHFSKIIADALRQGELLRSFSRIMVFSSTGKLNVRRKELFECDCFFCFPSTNNGCGAGELINSTQAESEVSRVVHYFINTKPIHKAISSPSLMVSAAIKRSLQAISKNTSIVVINK